MYQVSGSDFYRFNFNYRIIGDIGQSCQLFLRKSSGFSHFFSNFLILQNQNFFSNITGSKNWLPAYGREGQGQHLFLLAAHFAKRNTKFGGGESEGRQKFLPSNLSTFCLLVLTGGCGLN